YDVCLAIKISQGRRESIIPGTPEDYVKLYTAMIEKTNINGNDDEDKSDFQLSKQQLCLDSVNASSIVITYRQFFPLVKEVSDILNKVIVLYKTAQHNKNITKVLVERIIAASSAVEMLKAREDLFTLKNYTSLQRLIQVLQKMKKFIEEITQPNTDYDSSINLLNFTLTVDFRINSDKDDKILKEDIEELLKFQEALAESIDKVNLVIEKVNEMQITMQSLINNPKNEKQPQLPFGDYEEADEPPRSDSRASDKVNLVIEKVNKMQITMQSLINNPKNEKQPQLPFGDYEEADEPPRSDSRASDKVNLVIEKVNEMQIIMQNLINNPKNEQQNQNRIDNIFNEPQLPFGDYEEADEPPRSDRLRKYVHVKTKEDFAFKRLDKGNYNTVKNQAIFLKKLKDCQNIIHFYGLTKDDKDDFYLVTEWAEYKNLREYITSNGQNIDMKLRIRFAYDIAKGNLSANIESLVYTAPEMLKRITEVAGKNENNKRIAEEETNKKYDTKCEVYSFGILLWEIAECRIPYEDISDFLEITRLVISGHREPFTPGIDIPEKYKSLVNISVDQNPGLRPILAKMLTDLRDIFHNY
ncbi:13784_t:CDS:2, partial [Funneliformis geosporum]